MTDSKPVEMSEADAVVQQHWLFQAIDEMFSENPSNTVTLGNGRVVEIRTSKVKTLREITALVASYLGSYTPEELLELLSFTSKAQQELTSEGADPFKDTLAKISTYVGGAEMIARIVTTGLEINTELMPLFTNLTADEFDDLGAEEGAIVAYSVFGRNYHFFSQRVRPVVAGFIESRARLARKNSEPQK